MPKPFAHMLGVLFVALTLACHQSLTASDFIAEENPLLCAQIGAFYSECAGAAAYVSDGACPAADSSAFTSVVAAGRIRYDSAQASACLEGLQHGFSSCAALTPDACFSVFSGSLAAGEPCSFDDECASGACGGTCPTTCQAVPESESPGKPCPCDAVFSLTCKNGFCVSQGGLNDACASDGECESRFKCSGGACVFRAAGEACGPQARCGPGSGLYCDSSACNLAVDPSCTGIGICRLRQPAGSTCFSNSETIFGLFNAPSSIVGVGTDTRFDGNSCAEGLGCIGAGLGTGGTCGAMVDLGGACAEGSHVVSGCKAGLVCSGGVCTTPPVSGPCLQSTCDPLVAFCDFPSGQCLSFVPAGGACTGDDVCLSGSCQQGTCVTGCGPAAALRPAPGLRPSLR
jgi:hypothetical protein